MSVEKTIHDTAKMSQTAVNESINLIKKAWSIMDAASEKTQPSDYLSQQAVQSIRGKPSLG